MENIEQAADEIVFKYDNILPEIGNLSYAVKCAITEVEACIETANDSIAFKQSKRDRLQQILTHLKSM